MQRKGCMEYHKYYQNLLYPLQNKFLAVFSEYNNEKFYLTGGTALSRFYFQHRYSEDLDFFSAKELKEFRKDIKDILDLAEKKFFSFEIEIISDSFARIFLQEDDTLLKIDFVNEVVFHWGEFKNFPLFACVDNAINILANKITAIMRYEAKDIVDIWILAKKLTFSWRDIMDIASKKSPVDPIEVSKVIQTLPLDELKFIKWATDVDNEVVYNDLQKIATDILLGNDNTVQCI